MVRIIQNDFHLVRFSTAVLAEIANRLGKNIEIVVVDSVGRAAALASGAVDAVFWTRTNDLSNQLFYPSAFLREIRLDPRLYILPDVFPIGGIIRKMQTRGSEEIRNLICPYFHPFFPVRAASLTCISDVGIMEQQLSVIKEPGM